MNISLAIIRSVSLRLQDEGQKKLTDFTDAHGVFDTDFFDLCFFSNTNRTNLTNLLGCDMVYIRGIREIRGQEPAASGNACKSV